VLTFVWCVTDIPVYGFSPINHTKVLLHDHDEHVCSPLPSRLSFLFPNSRLTLLFGVQLDASIFLKGIGIYEKLIPDIANQQS
jgi:hypothetical protein